MSPLPLFALLTLAPLLPVRAGDPPLCHLAPDGCVLWIEAKELGLSLPQLRELALGITRARDLVQELGRGPDPRDKVRPFLEAAKGIERGPVGRAVQELLDAELAITSTGDLRVFAIARVRDASQAADIARRLRKLLGPAITCRGRHVLLGPAGPAGALLRKLPRDGTGPSPQGARLAQLLPAGAPVRGYVDLRALPGAANAERETADVLGTLLVHSLRPLYKAADELLFSGSAREGSAAPRGQTARRRPRPFARDPRSARTRGACRPAAAPGRAHRRALRESPQLRRSR